MESFIHEASGFLKSAQLSYNPDQTNLSKLIKVFRIIRKSQEGKLNQGLS